MEENPLDAGLRVLAQYTRLPYGPHPFGNGRSVIVGTPDALERNRQVLERVLAAMSAEAAPRVGGVSITASCTHPECARSQTVVTSREDALTDFSWNGDNLPDGRAHLYVDTGWIYLPEGWSLAEDGPRCPEHREEETP